MSWASRRQAVFLSIILFIFGLLLFSILYPILSKAPSCIDGIKNGSELEIDCGGVCSRLCSSQVSEPIVIWSRAFPVVGSTYNLVAFVENQNRTAGVEKATYEFRAYDTQNRLIGRREGTTFIPPNQQFAIFEPRFDAGQASIRTVSFMFTGQSLWMKKNPTLQTLPLRVGAVIFGGEENTPVLTAQMTNDSIYDMPSFDVVTILYDQDRNAIQVSKTHKEELRAGQTSSLLFTWPQSFSTQPVVWDIFPMINPFTVEL